MERVADYANFPVSDNCNVPVVVMLLLAGRPIIPSACRPTLAARPCNSASCSRQRLHKASRTKEPLGLPGGFAFGVSSLTPSVPLSGLLSPSPSTPHNRRCHQPDRISTAVAAQIGADYYVMQQQRLPSPVQRPARRGERSRLSDVIDERLLPLVEHRKQQSRDRIVFDVHAGKHFQPGTDVFDVAIEGKEVLTDFDVVREAGGPMIGLVKEFGGISADGDMTIALTVKKGVVVLCGVEIIAELDKSR